MYRYVVGVSIFCTLRLSADSNVCSVTVGLGFDVSEVISVQLKIPLCALQIGTLSVVEI